MNFKVFRFSNLRYIVSYKTLPLYRRTVNSKKGIIVLRISIIRINIYKSPPLYPLAN